MSSLSELTPKPGDDRRVEAGHPIMDAACFVAGRWEWVADGSAVTVTRDTLSDDWQLVTPEPPEPEIERWPLVYQHMGKEVKVMLAQNPSVQYAYHRADDLPLMQEHTFLGYEGKLPNGKEWPMPFAAWVLWDDVLATWHDPTVQTEDRCGHPIHAITPLDGGEAWARMRRKEARK